jgi:hypothetical protein
MNKLNTFNKKEKIFLFLFLFLFLLAPYVNLFFGGINFAIIAYFIYIIFDFRSFNWALKNQKKSLITFVMILVMYVMGTSIVSNQIEFSIYKIITSVVSYIIFGMAIGYSFYCRHISLELAVEYFLKMVMIIITLNSAIILIEFFNPNVKNTIELYLYNSGNIDYTSSQIRFRGLASAGGASLSIFHMIGILIAFYLYRLRKVTTIVFFVVFSIILFSLMFIGRTGIILSFIGILMIVFIRFKEGILRYFWNRLAYLSIFLIIVAYLPYILSSVLPDSIIDRSVSFFLSGVDGISNEGTVPAVANMYKIPENWNDLLFGIGNYSGNFINDRVSDPGYLKMLTAIGLPLSILTYIIVSKFILIQFFKTIWNKLIFILIILLLIAEFKEPVFFTGYSSRFLFLFTGLMLSYRSMFKKNH